MTRIDKIEQILQIEWNSQLETYVMTPEDVMYPLSYRDQVAKLMALIAEERLDVRKEIALDNYKGHTFSADTDYKSRFEWFMNDNDRAIERLASKETSL